MSHASSSAHQTPPPEVVADIERQKRLFIRVGVVQVLLTALTVGVSYTRVGGVAGQIAASLLVASVNASIVGAILMHLKWEKKWIYWVMGLTFIAFAIMVWASCLAFHDKIHPI
jgi:cytochrome c oxidase subunit IV